MNRLRDSVGTPYHPECWAAKKAEIAAKERKAFWLLLGVNLVVWARVGLVLLEMVK